MRSGSRRDGERRAERERVNSRFEVTTRSGEEMYIGENRAKRGLENDGSGGEMIGR